MINRIQFALALAAVILRLSINCIYFAKLSLMNMTRMVLLGPIVLITKLSHVIFTLTWHFLHW